MLVPLQLPCVKNDKCIPKLAECIDKLELSASAKPASCAHARTLYRTSFDYPAYPPFAFTKKYSTHTRVCSSVRASPLFHFPFLPLFDCLLTDIFSTLATPSLVCLETLTIDLRVRVGK